MKKSIIIIAIFSLFLIVGCTKQENDIQILTGSSVNIDINNFAFSPSDVKIKTGTTVTWTNDDNAVHTVTGNELDSGTLEKGQTYSHTFLTPGTYEYYCSLHTSMNGNIIVE